MQRIADDSVVAVDSRIRILVMDDDPVVLEVLGFQFEKLGYDASFCIKANEAVEAYAKAFEDGHPFDIVFLDLMLYGVREAENVLSKMLEISPDLKPILHSYNVDDIAMLDPRRFGFRAALPKLPPTKSLKSIITEIMMAA